jgi:hypothetical protein
LPSRALWELEHDPDQWAVRILLLRTYAQTKAEYDRDASKVPPGPIRGLVEEFDFEPVEARAEQIRARLQAEALKGRSGG